MIFQVNKTYIPVLFALLPFIAACSHQKSMVKVVSGQPTLDYPAVVALEFRNDAGENLGLCTGEFISPRVALTAAHCFDDDARPFLIYEGSEIPAEKYLIHPDYVVDAEETVQHDLAMIIFKDYHHPQKLSLAHTPPKIGSSVQFVGFGKSIFTTKPGQGIGTKRVGTLKVDKLSEGYFQSIREADGSDAAAAPGDSGGALLWEGALVAVSSLGGPDGQGRLVNQFINLLSPSSRKFLQTPGWDVDVPRD